MRQKSGFSPAFLLLSWDGNERHFLILPSNFDNIVQQCEYGVDRCGGICYAKDCIQPPRAGPAHGAHHRKWKWRLNTTQKKTFFEWTKNPPTEFPTVRGMDGPFSPKTLSMIDEHQPPPPRGRPWRKTSTHREVGMTSPRPRGERIRERMPPPGKRWA